MGNLNCYRNALALVKKTGRAIRHGDEDEILTAVLNLIEESFWALCWLAAGVCLVAGFFKWWCFFEAPIFALLGAMIRSNIDDRRVQED